MHEEDGAHHGKGRGKGGKGKRHAGSVCRQDVGRQPRGFCHAFWSALGLGDTSEEDDAHHHGKGRGKGGKGKRRDWSLQSDEVEGAGKSHLGKERKPHDGQKLIVVCKVVEAKNVPSVNLLGGVDPFVEVRAAKGYAAKATLSTLAAHVPKQPVQTTSHSGQSNPQWNEILEVKDVVFDGMDMNLQFILWDYNLTGNTAIGQGTLMLAQALKGCSYKAWAPATEVRENEQTIPIEGELCKDCHITVKFSYREVHKITLTVVQAKRLPITDSFGTCDAFVDVRLVKGNQCDVPVSSEPGLECAYHTKTGTMRNSQDPQWHAKFSFMSDGDPDLHLFFIVWDDDSPQPAQPVGCATIALKDVVSGTPSEDPAPVKHKLKLSQVKGGENVKDLEHATLYVELAWVIAWK